MARGGNARFSETRREVLGGEGPAGPPDSELRRLGHRRHLPHLVRQRHPAGRGYDAACLGVRGSDRAPAEPPDPPHTAAGLAGRPARRRDRAASAQRHGRGCDDDRGAARTRGPDLGCRGARADHGEPDLPGRSGRLQPVHLCLHPGPAGHQPRHVRASDPRPCRPDDLAARDGTPAGAAPGNGRPHRRLSRRDPADRHSAADP